MTSTPEHVCHCEYLLYQYCEYCEDRVPRTHVFVKDDNAMKVCGVCLAELSVLKATAQMGIEMVASNRLLSAAVETLRTLVGTYTEGAADQRAAARQIG